MRHRRRAWPSVLLSVIGAQIALSRRAGIWWLITYLVTLTVTTAVADAVDPVYDSEWTSAGVASTLVGVTVLMFAALAYFVGQRDRYQQESDDLLHNILPEQIAARLKADSSMIADGVDDASVLFRFADIVGFTSQSAQHSPERIVRMLDSVSTRLDALVDDPPIGENATPIDVALWAHENLQHERRQREQIEQTLRASISAAEGRALIEVDGVRQDATSQLARHGRMIERAALGELGAAVLGGLLTVIGLLLQGAPGT